MKTKSDITRERILDRAVDIFSKKGFAASRTSEIAKAADVSEATIFKYYKSKQGILDGVVEIFVDHVSTQVIIEPLERIFEENKDSSPKVVFKKLFINRIELIQRFKKYASVAIMESRFNTGIREQIATYIYPHAKKFGEKIVNHYKEQGIFREDLDPWITIRTAMMAVVGMVFANEFIGIENDSESYEEELDAVIDIILRGAMTDEWRLQNKGCE